MSIVIPGQMYKKVYKQLNMAPENLSRTLKDAGTLTSGLVPWSTCGAVYLATLNVSAFAYGRYHLIGIINPIIAIIYAYASIFLKAVLSLDVVWNAVDIAMAVMTLTNLVALIRLHR